MPTHIDYRAVKDVLSARTDFKSLVTNILGAPENDVAFGNKLWENGQRLVLEPRQKILELIKDVLRKMCNHGQLLLVAFALMLLTECHPIVEKTYGT